MRVRGYILGLFLTGCMFAPPAIILMTSSSVENTIKSFSLVPMTIKPEVTGSTQGSKPKKIVWFDYYNKNHGLRNSVSNARFDTCKGAAKNCIILPHIMDAQTQKTVVVDADAVIFQGCHLYKLTAPRRKNSDQVFVFAERENWYTKTYDKIEHHAMSKLYAFRDVFNWTMSYRRDSDIMFPYGEIKKSPESVPKKDFRKVYKKKKYDAVWFVSHCVTPSLREAFVQEMQKYITVHIYGKCGTFSCPRKQVERDPNNDCLENAIEKYKFVLSFENSYRPNYVTEKLFDWFPRDIVPVVRGGGGNYTDYGVPEGTIIDADEYSSAMELALFLKSVGASQTKYTEYLKRKQGYYSVSLDEKQTEGYCKLCEMLQNVQKFRKSYTHIGAWWDSEYLSGTYPNMHKVRMIYRFLLLFVVILSLVGYKFLIKNV